MERVAVIGKDEDEVCFACDRILEVCLSKMKSLEVDEEEPEVLGRALGRTPQLPFRTAKKLELLAQACPPSGSIQSFLAKVR